MTQVGVDPSTNKWDQPFVLGVVDPHDSLSHPAGVSDVQAESAICVDPDLFTNFLVCQVDCELNSGLVWLSTIFFSCIIFFKHGYFLLQIPNLFDDAVQDPTECNPFPLPEIYQASQSKKVH
jgi:TBCC domain-containing protein 1